MSIDAVSGNRQSTTFQNNLDTGSADRAASVGAIASGAAGFATPSSPVEQGAALRALDSQTGSRLVSDAIARGEKSAPETCRVDVQYNSIGATANIASHAYIVTRDGDSTNYFRGGPTGVGIGSGSSGSGASSASSNTSGGDQAQRGWGTITTEYGAYRQGTRDWNPNPRAVQNVTNAPGNCDAIESGFRTTADAIRNANVPYSPFGPNSNSVVRELLENNGITGVTPVTNAPGWSSNIPF